MKSLCIVHFHELEKYPPAINFVKYLSSQVKEGTDIHVLTTRPANHDMISIPGVNIHRFGTWKTRMTKWERSLVYIKFNIYSFLLLWRKSPSAILYYETLSAGPAWMIRKLLGRKSQIFIHYHEYISPPEYANGMVLNRWLHNREKALLPEAKWVSHTNADRMNLFLNDLNGNKPTATHIIPNYPPRSWLRRLDHESKRKIAFVYVGALSMDTMYLEEMARFVSNHRDECYWDIYSTNVSQDAMQYIERFKEGNIHFKGGILYDELPGILPQYDVGLILYKGHIPNYVFNAPNKLFEYHVCGLDVWFPTSMKSSLEYSTTGTFPRIVGIDFNQLDSLDLRKETQHAQLEFRQAEFACEKVLEPLVKEMTGSIGNRQ